GAAARTRQSGSRRFMGSLAGDRGAATLRRPGTLVPDQCSEAAAWRGAALALRRTSEAIGGLGYWRARLRPSRPLTAGPARREPRPPPPDRPSVGLLRRDARPGRRLHAVAQEEARVRRLVV